MSKVRLDGEIRQAPSLIVHAAAFAGELATSGINSTVDAVTGVIQGLIEAAGGSIKGQSTESTRAATIMKQKSESGPTEI